jgi:cell division septation protein DedD
MRNKETGEFELVVGDKQLLSGFFIGVLLLAVVFALGYVLGRGTPKSASVASETPATPTAEYHPPVVSTPPPATPAVMNPDVGHLDATPPAEGTPQPTTVPAKGDAPQAAQAAPPPPKPASAPSAAPEAPPDASYWQVLAGSQSSAAALSQTLKGQGFPVITRQGSNNYTLVWVGPYTDKAAFSKAKKQLEDAGITNLFKKP